MKLFYVPDISADDIELPAEESHHIINVLRLQKGDQLEITNGRGELYQCEIIGTDKKRVSAIIKRQLSIEQDRNYKLHIAIAPPKNINRFEWFLEKATEIGIDEITPIITENSERKELRIERLEKIVIAAMKQSLKAYKPVLNPVISLDDFLQHKYADYQLFIAYCGMEDRGFLKNLYKAGNNATILIGPEGDFSNDEVRLAKEKGYRTVSLGGSRLRTETAGIVACHAIYLLNSH